MKLSAALPFTAISLSLLGRVQAQSEALLSLEAQYPSCALQCMAEYIPQSSCGITDFDCICTNKILNANITICARKSCSVKEVLTTKNVSSTICRAEVRDRTAQVSWIGMSLGCLAFIAFVLRLAATKIRGAWGLDDTIITIVVILATPPTIFTIVLAENGLGKDIWNVPFDNITRILHVYFIGENFYLAALALTRISILCFYLRIFPDENHRRMVFVAIALCAAYGIAFVAATLLQCTPMNYAWNAWDGEHVGFCNNINLQGWLSAILIMLLDIMTIILPLPQLYRLNMSWNKKIMLMFMFCLGFFVTIISIVRLHTLIQFAKSENITWDYVPAAYWSTMEMHVGIICACLPAHRQLFSRIVPKVFGSTKGTSSSGSDPSSRFSAVRSVIPLKDISRGPKLKSRLSTADKCIVVTSELHVQTENGSTQCLTHPGKNFGPGADV